MQNTLTEIDLCNLALDRVGGYSIQNINDTKNPNSIVLNRNYDNTVRSLLAQFEWDFAVKRIIPTPVPPEFETIYETINGETTEKKILKRNGIWVDGYCCYKLPDDFSRLSMYFFSAVYPYRTNQYVTGYNYFRSNTHLYTRNPLAELVYVGSTPSIKDYSQLFIDTLVSSLAVKVAPKIKGSEVDMRILQQEYMFNLKLAKKNQMLQMEASSTGMSELQEGRISYFGM